ncbi:hypothetical protein G7Y89_g15726 [Cudoniella acicularis]|uniref:Ricin B lectin domain-containing protein n=1 Tax=Cudoniella acicularis TaxID=354080 RepID=A0A8H4VI79_9HELO|nr:hypothetical protein G7Y89_g15726 [Cudoniella acicularis]
MYQYIFLLVISLLLAQPSQSFGEPVVNGSKYLLSSEETGGNYCLGCGAANVPNNDQLCSMVVLSGSQHDGWIMNTYPGTEKSWQLIKHGTDGINLALDIYTAGGILTFGAQTGQKVLANTDTDWSNNLSQLWTLSLQADGSYFLANNAIQGQLDVDSGITPFLNQQVDSSLTGQYWFFRLVEPQTTTTVFTTSTQTVNSFASSTTTVTITVCPSRVREESSSQDSKL